MNARRAPRLETSDRRQLVRFRRLRERMRAKPRGLAPKKPYKPSPVLFWEWFEWLPRHMRDRLDYARNGDALQEAYYRLVHETWQAFLVERYSDHPQRR